MLVFTDGYDNHNVEELNDVSQLLTPNQILLRGNGKDAARAVSVLGSAKASYAPIIWKRKSKQITPYTDYIVTIN